MKVLIVHAHPEPKSFTSALKDEAISVLTGSGHEVEVSDLYAQHFSPVAGEEDFLNRQDEGYLVYAREQRHGFEGQTLAPDILKEIDKVRRCDLLLLTFPIFWFSVPAIMKGWIDRVFVSGAFYGGRRVYDRGGMLGKRAMVCTTMGGRRHMLTAGGLHGDLTAMLRPLLQGTLGYVGFEVLEPFYGYHVPYIADEKRAEMLDQWRAAVQTLDARAVLRMPSLEDFDDTFAPLTGAARPDLSHLT